MSRRAVPVLCFVFLCATWSFAQSADIIIHNAKVLTVDASFSVAEALAIGGNKILAVGTNSEVLKLAGPNTQKIDVKGRTVIPGLINTHQHIHNYAEGAYGSNLGPEKMKVFPLDWKGVKSKDDVLNQIRGSMDKYKFKPGEWIYFNNIDADRSPETIKILYDILDRWELAKVTPNNPVALDIAIPDFNGYLLNDMAMNILWAKHADFMKKYGRFWINKAGLPDGHLEPPAARLLLQYLQYPAAEDLAPVYKAYLDEQAAGGITTVSTRLPAYSKATFDLLRSRGEMTLRLGAGLQDVFGNLPELEIEKGLQKYSGVAGTGDDTMWVTSLGPTAIDGGGTRACTNQKRKGQLEFIDNWWPTGQCHTDAEFRGAAGRAASIQGSYFREWVFASAKTNVRFANTHVAGDRSVRNMLDMIEQVQKQSGAKATEGWAFDHCRYVDPRDFARLAKLKVSMSCAPKYIESGKNVSDAFSPDMANKFLVPIGSMLKAGVKVVYEADRDTYDFRDLEIAVTRKDREGRVWGAQEAVDRPTALRMITSWAAEYVLRPDKIGSLEKGKLADVVVLDKDFMTIPAEDISELRPRMTIVDGRIVFLHTDFAAEQNLKPAGAVISSYEALNAKRTRRGRIADF
jgi:predicted amidohydrolase YtcJ